MTKKIFIVCIFNVLLLMVTAFLAYNILNVGEKNVGEKRSDKERKVLFWYDPMYPNTKFDAPGPSPFMDMDLVPKYVDDEQIGFAIDPVQKQNIGLKVSKAHFGNLEFSYTIPANLDYNNHDVVVIQPRAEGFVEKVYPFTVGDSVKKGDPLIEITVPQWVEAQSEYLYSQDVSALERLRLLGMPIENIENLKKTAKIQTRFIIRASISGVIAEYELREGMNFSKQNIIAKIQSVSPIWIFAYAPQSLSGLISEKSSLKAYFTALPNQEFPLVQTKILPSADKDTKTLIIRAKIENRDNLLKPNMDAYIKVNTQSGTMLLIPSSAVIDQGKKQHVIVSDENDRLIPKQIKVLGEANGKTAILGLHENDSVVSSGVFLIDSEANIIGALDKMAPIDNMVTDNGQMGN